MGKLRMSYRLTKQGRENFHKWKLCSNGEFVLPSWVIEACIDSLKGFDIVCFFVATDVTFNMAVSCGLWLMYVFQL
jgi:hypothetical protein